MAADKPSSKGQAWFCTTGLPSDISIEVDDMTFHLHKFPFMSRSRKLHQLITEQETNQGTTVQTTSLQDEGNVEEEIEEAHCHIALPEFPGGSETFELAAKFCYGVKIELSSSNVAPLRCAGEYLEMTEDYSEDNLISKAERFLSQSVFKNIKDSIKTLTSCERLMPLAETLDITQRCINSIIERASSADPSLFGWPVSDGPGEGRASKNHILWNGIETGGRRKSTNRPNGRDAWYEDLAFLSLPLFKRLILAMRAGDLSSEIIESCLIYYAKKYIPGISRSTRKPSSSSVASETEQKELLETIITHIPVEKSSRSSTATRFLFGLLRTANILNISEASKSALERRIGLQLDQATLDDLLIPSYSYLTETLYDVDCVERILCNFLEGLYEKSENGDEGEDVDRGGIKSPALMLVGKLIDGYLSEIASDANLKPGKFCALAVILPEQARLFDDGLYRAVDVYLKAHPWISEAEREKICGVMDCQKLTLEACTHAAQNERLPLRAVVQVLFFEQLQLRHAIAGSLMAADVGQPDSARPSLPQQDQAEDDTVSAPPARDGSNTWRAAVRENQVLRLDMDSMRSRVHELERECSSMRKVIEKMDKPRSRESEPRGGWKGSLTKGFGCKFKTQVCDSHESTVVGARKGRHQHHD